MNGERRLFRAFGEESVASSDDDPAAFAVDVLDEFLGSEVDEAQLRVVVGEPADDVRVHPALRPRLVPFGHSLESLGDVVGDDDELLAQVVAVAGDDGRVLDSLDGIESVNPAELARFGHLPPHFVHAELRVEGFELVLEHVPAENRSEVVEEVVSGRRSVVVRRDLRGRRERGERPVVRIDDVDAHVGAGESAGDAGRGVVLLDGLDRSRRPVGLVRTSRLVEDGGVLDFEGNSVLGERDDSGKALLALGNSPHPVPVGVRVVRGKQVSEKRLGIVLDDVRHAEVPLAPRTRTRLLRRDVVLPGVRPDVFAGVAELRLARFDFAFLGDLLGNVLDVDVEDDHASDVSYGIEKTSDAGVHDSAGAGVHRDFDVAGLLPAGVDGLVGRRDEPRGVVVREQTARLLGRPTAYSEFGEELVVRLNDFERVVLHRENEGGTDVLAEEHALRRVGVEQLRHVGDASAARDGDGLELGRPQKPDELVLVYRLGVEIALHVVAPDALHEVGLPRSLDALGYERGVQPPRQPRHGTDDDASASVGVARKEAQVELDDVDRQVLQDVERGVPASEVVHLDDVPAVVELVEDSLDELRPSDGRGLGNLGPQQVHGNVVLLSNRLEFPNVVVTVNVVSRYVERNGNDGVAGVEASPDEVAYDAEHVEVRLVHEAGLLENRYEVGGTLLAVLVVSPAHESLGSDHATRRVVELGLITGVDASVRERGPEFLLYLGLGHRLLHSSRTFGEFPERFGEKIDETFSQNERKAAFPSNFRAKSAWNVGTSKRRNVGGSKRGTKPT